MPLVAATTDKFMKVGSPGTATTLSAPGYTDGVSTTINVVSTTNWPTDTLVTFAMDTITISGGVATRVPGSYCEFVGIVSSATSIGNLVRRYGTGQNYPAGSTTRVYIPVAGTRENDLIDGLNQDHNGKGNHKDLTDDNGNVWLGRGQTASAVNNLKTTNAATGNAPTVEAVGSDTNINLNLKPKGSGRIQESGNNLIPVGTIWPYAGRSAPTGWVFPVGQALSRASFVDLFNALVPSLGTMSVTIAAPGVVTLNSHGLITGDQVYITTTGALPTGLAINTLYYAVFIDANTFNLATTRANAIAGTKITTTGSQSGVHTLFFCPHGLGDGTTTFNAPDARGRTLVGADAMGGTAASRLTNPTTTSGGTYGQLGASGGEQAHQISIAELASHAHTENFSSGALNGVTGISQVANQSTAPGIASTYTTQNTGSDTAHNNVQPTLVVNCIMKV